MSGINKAILIGRLGKDPEIRYTNSGAPVANFNVATSETFTSRDGKKEEKTEWHKIVAWGKLGELCGEYLSKGRRVYVEGKIQTRSYDDKAGVKKYITEIVANTVQFLDGGQRDGAQRDGGPKKGPSTEQEEPLPDFEDNQKNPAPDDDIPF